MKKKFLIPVLVLVGCLFFAACGRSSKSAYYSGEEMYFDEAADDYYVQPNADSAQMVSTRGFSKSTASSSSNGKSASGSTGEAQSADIVQRKVIKTASLEIQTRTFDDFIDSLNKKIDGFGAYIESANVSGNNIYSTSSRRAYFTIRVPEDQLQDMIDSIGSIGTVITSNYNEEDITLAYVDVESRIKTLTTEQETLLGLLEKAAYLEDIIRLEERLSEVNYQLETYKSRQRTYDNKVSYSTLNINVQEVMRIATVVEPEPQTLGQRIATGFKENLLNIKTGCENFIVWFISYIFNIIFFCGIIAVVVILAVRRNRKIVEMRKNRQLQQSEKSNETEMGNNK